MVLCQEDLARKIDFARCFPSCRAGPFMHVIAAKAVCFGEALSPDYARYAGQIVSNAQTMATELSEAGLRLVSGGTDNHLILVDLTPLGLTGGRAVEVALENVGISANKNAIPFDPRPPRGDQRPAPRDSGDNQPGVQGVRVPAGGAIDSPAAYEHGG